MLFKISFNIDISNEDFVTLWSFSKIHNFTLSFMTYYNPFNKITNNQYIISKFVNKEYNVSDDIYDLMEFEHITKLIEGYNMKIIRKRLELYKIYNNSDNSEKSYNEYRLIFKENKSNKSVKTVSIFDIILDICNEYQSCFPMLNLCNSEIIIVVRSSKNLAKEIYNKLSNESLDLVNIDDVCVIYDSNKNLDNNMML